MRRILFTWHGFNVYSYPVMLYLGMVLGVVSGARLARTVGIDPDSFATATIILVVPSLIGSRLLFVFTNWNIYRRDPKRIWRRSEGGMTMYGGLIAAIPLSIPLLYLMRLPFAAYWDAASATMLIGMIPARIGCLLNGCCSGRPTSAWFGIRLPDYRGVRQRRIPTQILELVWGAVVLGGLLLMWRRQFPTGLIFCLTVIAYSAGRFFMEPLRDKHGCNDTTILRTLSLALVVSALVGVGLVLSR